MRDLEQTATPPGRLESLDTFRGLTIGLMILVNNPGSWGKMYKPLVHAQWDGAWRPVDMVFPFFLFIVGVAMTFSFDKRLALGGGRADLLKKAFGRTVILILLGWILQSFPNFRMGIPFILGIVGIRLLETDKEKPNARSLIVGGWVALAVAALWLIVDWGHWMGGKNAGANWALVFAPLTGEAGQGGYLRLPGVLQRIALAYFATAVILVAAGVRGRIAWTAVILLGYYLLVLFVPAPEGFEIASGAENARRDATEGAPFPGALHDWIDTVLFGPHLYSARPDPEGLLSTLPAVATTLLGTLTGTLLRDKGRSAMSKLQWMLGAGVALVLAGLLWHLAFPINKKIWTSSYVLFMGGAALLVLGVCYFLNDVKGWRGWSKPLVVFGLNAIVLFFGSGILARAMNATTWDKASGDGKWNVKSWIYDNLFAFNGSTELTSFLFSLVYLVFWLGILWVLYRKKWFFKV